MRYGTAGNLGWHRRDVYHTGSDGAQPALDKPDKRAGDGDHLRTDPGNRRETCRHEGSRCHPQYKTELSSSTQNDFR